MAEAIRNTDAERAAVVFYGTSLFITLALVSVLWGSIRRDRQLLKPELSDQEVVAVTRAATPSIPFFLACIVLAIIAPKVAAFGYLVIAVVTVLRARADKPPTTTDPAQDGN